MGAADDKSILQEAQGIIHGARNQEYGHPLDNHQATADILRAWIRRRFGVDIELTAEDVCWLNILQKASRGANITKRDTIVDVAGYAANIEMIWLEKMKREKTVPEKSTG